MNVRQAVKRITNEAEKLGWSVEEREAQTGTAYLACSRDEIELTIRVADHGECYPPRRGERRVCVDPLGGELGDAIAALTDPITVEPFVPDPVAFAENQKTLSEQARVEKVQRRGAANNAETVRAMLTDEDRSEWNRLGHSRNTARIIAERLGVKPGRVYKAFTGRNF